MNLLRRYLIALFAGLASACHVPPPADLVLVNGGIYTMNPAQAWAEALAVRDGRIVAIGSNREVERLLGPATRRIDLAGGMALPGFHDTHIHVIEGGLALNGCILGDPLTLELTLELLSECAGRIPSGWLVAEGILHTVMPGGSADKDVLDTHFPDRPVFISTSGAHTAWVNSRALAMAGIDRETPDPPNGSIVRDPVTGEATGRLDEVAMSLFDALLPPRTPESDRQALLAAQAYLLSYGVTSVFDIARSGQDWAAWKAFADSGDMALRASTTLVIGKWSDYPAEDFESLWASRDRYRAPGLKHDSVKVYLDGEIENRTAVLIEPYHSDPNYRGDEFIEAGTLNRLVQRFDAAGVPVHMHTIGDGAVRAGLDAVESARNINGPRDTRHLLTHLQLVDHADIPRFARLGVAASFQPLWAYPDVFIMDINLPDVGYERVERMYPIGSFFRQGVHVSGSSDWAVSSANPLEAIETAVRRQDSDLDDGPVLNPSERAGLGDMLRAYTIEGAWTMHQELETGSLEAGKFADIVVLDRNLFEIPVTAINNARVRLTVFAGEVVYESADRD